MMSDEFEKCEDCPHSDECKAKGCYQDYLHQEEMRRQEQLEWERREYERMWHEENGM